MLEVGKCDPFVEDSVVASEIAAWTIVSRTIVLLSVLQCYFGDYVPRRLWYRLQVYSIVFRDTVLLWELQCCLADYSVALRTIVSS